MSADSLTQAINLINDDKKDEAKKILSNLLILQPNYWEAWYWLYICSESTDRKIYCLSQILQINPDRNDIREIYEGLIYPDKENYFASPQIQFQKEKLEETITAQSRDEERKITNSPIKNEAGNTRNYKKITKTSGTKKKKRKQKEGGNIIDLAKINIKKILEKQENNVSESKEQKNENESIIPYIPPEIIYIKPDDNIYADANWTLTNFPRFEGGLFGDTFFIDDIRITPFSLPTCLKLGYILDEERCELCDFFSFYDCIFIDDPDLFNEVRIFLIGKRQQLIKYRIQKKSAIRAIYHELKIHGRPLHYSVLARIVIDRYPRLGLTERKVHRTMLSHINMFENIGDGVFKCKIFRK